MVQWLEVSYITLYLPAGGGTTLDVGFHGTESRAWWPGESEAINTWADRAADGWLGSGCLGGKCAKWYWHMFPRVFDLLVSPKTLLKAWKRDWKVVMVKKSWKRKGKDSQMARASLSSVWLICITNNYFIHPKKYQNAISDFPSPFQPPLPLAQECKNAKKKTEGASWAGGLWAGTELVWPHRSSLLTYLRTIHTNIHCAALWVTPALRFWTVYSIK